MATIKRTKIPEPNERNYIMTPAEHGGFNPDGCHPSGYPGCVAKDGKYATDENTEANATTAGGGFPDVDPGDFGLLDRNGARKELGIARGAVPAFQATTPGMSMMTIDIPSSQSKEAWGSLLQLLYLCDGILVLRPTCESRPLEDSILNTKKFLAHVWEIVDSRPMNIVCICNGPIRGAMMIWPAIAQLVIATKDATFAMPTYNAGLVNSYVHTALKKRLKDTVHKRLTLVGDTIDANEAHRFGLADFVGDEETCENELSRIVFSSCSPHVTYYMHKSDLNRAVGEKEALEEGDSDGDMPRPSGEELYPF